MYSVSTLIRSGKFLLAVLSGTFLFSFNSFGQETFTIEKSSTTKIDLDRYLYHLENATSQPQLFTEVVGLLPINRKHSFLFYLKNNTSDSVHYGLQFGDGYVHASNVIINIQGSNNKIPIRGLLNEVPINIGPQETIVVSFDVRELDRLNPRKFSAYLIPDKVLAENHHHLVATQSFFLGLLAFLSVFNLIIYFVTRWKVYIKYAAYITSALLYFLYYYGFLQETFPAVKEISINLVSTWYYSVYILYFLFLNEFGEYKKYSPWADKLLNVGIINKCIQLIYESILNPLGVEFIYSPWYKNTILGAEIILMSFIIYFILKNTNIRGKIVVLASLMLIIGAILGQLEFETSLRGTLVQLGITAELLTFSAGLGYLTKEFYTGQQKAQAELIDQLQENQKMQETIQEKLEKTVFERTAELEKRNKENESLLTEIHHRVKNNLQIISSLINLKARQSDSPETNEALQQLNGRIFSMGLVHEKLYQNDNIKTIQLDEYLAEISRHLLSSFEEKEHPISLQLNCQPVEMDLDKTLTCGLIINELVTNSVKYAFTPEQEQRQIAIELSKIENMVSLQISDNGSSAKPISGNFKKSFGSRFVDQLVITKLGGEWSVSGKNGFHVTIKFTLETNGTGKDQSNHHRR